MAATEMIQVRVNQQLKKQAIQLFTSRGLTLSQAIREYLENEIQEAILDPEIALQSIFDSADEKIATSGEEISLDSINEFLAQTRKERREKAQLAS